MGMKNNLKAEDLSTKQIISLMNYRKPREVKIKCGKYDKTFCPNCNHYVQEYKRYCSHCGQRLKWRNYYKSIETQKAIKESFDILWNQRHDDCYNSKQKTLSGIKKLVKKMR